MNILVIHPFIGRKELHMRSLKAFFLGLLILLLAGNFCFADDTLSKIKIDVQEFRLKNGMLFLIVERHTTPQVATRLAIRAGSALEKSGKTGIAHVLEHMMFKGTKNFGTLDFQKDEQLQNQIENAYQIVLAEKQKRKPDPVLIQQKIKEMEHLRREVQKIYVPQSFSAQLGKNGAVGVNAFTTKDQTQYTMSVPSDMLEQWFSMASEQLFEPSWREFYVEKDVVLREWAFRYINNPNGAAWLDLNAAAYQAHPYRNPVIGWKADMEKFNTQDAIAFHSEYYNPTNAVCVLVGDVSLKKARKLAEIYFGRYPAGRMAPEKVTAEPPQQGPRNNVRFLKGARTPLVRVGFHSARQGTKDFYALDAMTMVLSQGRSARTTQHIINKGLAVNAWAHNPDNRYGGMVILGGSPNEPDTLQGLSEKEMREAYLKDCRSLEEILLAEVDKLKTTPVSPSELKRIKKLNQRDFLDRIRSNEELAGTLATLEVQVGWRYLSTYLDKISEVTAEDIRRVATKYIRPDNKTSIYIIPGGTPKTPPQSYSEVRSVGSSAAANIMVPEDLDNHSIYPTPPDWKHPLSFRRTPAKIKYPAAETFNVKNAAVFYLNDSELPLIDLTLLVKAGSIDVPDSKIGLDQILNNTLVRGGTQTYGPSELAMILDENAIQVSVSVAEEHTRIRLSLMREDWEKGLTLLEDILRRPGFDARVFDVAKKQALIALKRQGEDAESVSMREEMIWHFQGHPYGRDPLSGLKTIPTITRQDLKAFINTYFVPANMVVGIAGDIKKEVVVAGLEKFFENFPSRPAPPRILSTPPVSPPALILIHKPGQVQSQISLGLSSVKRTHPDFWKISLLTNIFGGSDSLLYTRLRDDLGFVYSAWFYQMFKWEAGFLIGSIGCKSDRTGESIIETLNIMNSLHKEIPEKDFKLKQLDTLNSFVFNVDTPFELVEAYSRYRLRGESLDTLDRIQDVFIHANREELKTLARQFLDPNKIQIVVVADKTTRIKRKDQTEVTLEENLKALAAKRGLPFHEVELR